MNWFRKKEEHVYPPPVTIVEVKVEPLRSAMDLAQGMNAQRDAELQAAQARAAVSKLSASRIRNGFAPIIEESIIRRYLGSST